jgi:hypothetical protein
MAIAELDDETCEREAVSFLSGYCDGLLPPTPSPRGVGAEMPNRSVTVLRGIRGEGLNRLERHGLVGPRNCSYCGKPGHKASKCVAYSPVRYCAACRISHRGACAKEASR